MSSTDVIWHVTCIIKFPFFLKYEMTCMNYVLIFCNTKAECGNMIHACILI